MAISICLFNHKGGVSKTTTTFNLGWCLADMGKKVLIVDLDSQCNLTGLVFSFDATKDENMTVFYSNQDNLTMRPIVSALINGVSPDEFIRSEGYGKLYQTENRNLFLLPGHLDVSDLDAQISVSLKIASGIPGVKNIPGNLPSIIKKIVDLIEINLNMSSMISAQMSGDSMKLLLCRATILLSQLLLIIFVSKRLVL